MKTKATSSMTDKGVAGRNMVKLTAGQSSRRRLGRRGAGGGGGPYERRTAEMARSWVNQIMGVC